LHVMLNKSNIVLEINNIIMKKVVSLAIVISLVILTRFLWIGKVNPRIEELPLVIVILVIIGFALFILMRRFKSWKSNEPQEDELSKMVLMRTSSLAYYISLYFWVFLLWLKDRVAFDQEELIGTGILGMAFIFAGSWLFFYFKGPSK